MHKHPFSITTRENFSSPTGSSQAKHSSQQTTPSAANKTIKLLESSLSQCYSEMEGLVTLVKELKDENKYFKREVKALNQELAYWKQSCKVSSSEEFGDEEEDVERGQSRFAPMSDSTTNSKYSPSTNQSRQRIRDLEETTVTLTRLLESTEKSRSKADAENARLKLEMERMNAIVEDLRTEIEEYRQDSLGLEGLSVAIPKAVPFVHHSQDWNMQQQEQNIPSLGEDESFFVEYYSMDSFLVDSHVSTRLQSPVTVDSSTDKPATRSNSFLHSSSQRRFSHSSAAGLGLGLAYENLNDAPAVFSLLSAVPNPIGYTLGFQNYKKNNGEMEDGNVIEDVDGLDLVDRRTPIHLDEVEGGEESGENTSAEANAADETVLKKLIVVVYSFVFGAK